MSRTLIVGDVHGCLSELEALVNQAALTDDDHLVFVGDLVSKGPDSAGVVRYARERGALGVCGNHDAHWLASRAQSDARRALSGADWDYLANLPTHLCLDLSPIYEGVSRGQVRVVHAGLVRGVPPEDQDPRHLMTMRTLDDAGAPSADSRGRAWAADWPGPELVVFGHDAARGLQRHPHALGLDTGCCYGGQLSGALIDGERLEVLSVPAQAVYKAIR